MSIGPLSKPCFRRPDPRSHTTSGALRRFVLPSRSKGDSPNLFEGSGKSIPCQKERSRASLSDRSPYRFSGELRVVRPNLCPLARCSLVPIPCGDSGSRASLPRRVGLHPRRLPNPLGKDRSRCRPFFLPFLHLPLPRFRGSGLSGRTLDRICCDLASSPSRSLFSRSLLHHPSCPLRWTPTRRASRSSASRNFS